MSRGRATSGRVMASCSQQPGGVWWVWLRGHEKVLNSELLACRWNRSDMTNGEEGGVFSSNDNGGDGGDDDGDGDGDILGDDSGRPLVRGGVGMTAMHRLPALVRVSKNALSLSLSVASLWSPIGGSGALYER